MSKAARIIPSCGVRVFISRILLQEGRAGSPRILALDVVRVSEILCVSGRGASF
jgi:hypothetical protein